MGFTENIRNSWREILDVKEADDLPYVLLTEAINKSVLRGARNISVTYDGSTILVTDDAEPFDGKLESLLHYSVGIMNEEAAHIRRLAERQWIPCPYAVINALCKRFTILSSDGKTLRSVICEDGEITHSATEKVDFKRGNVFIIDPMLFMENVSAELMGNLLEYISYDFPKVTIRFKSKAEKGEDLNDPEDMGFISQESLFKELEPLYKELIKEVTSSPFNGDYFNVNELCTFTTRIGEKFPAGRNKGLLFYGRATNGWDDDIRDSLGEIFDSYSCRFFDIIGSVSKTLLGDDWNTRVGWSNICKIAPDGGNPGNTLWCAQYHSMVKIIKKEIDFLSPAAVILITGNTSGDHWHSPVCEEKAFPWGEEIDREQWGVYGKTGLPCTASVFRCDGILFILTDRPEGRSIQDHSDCLVRLLRKHGVA